MFKCRICVEKNKTIETLIKANENLQNQIKDLCDRFMAFNQNAFIHYKAETKQGKDLFPVAIDKDGKVFSYEDTDIEKTNEEIHRAMGEFPITVEDKNG